MQPGTGSGASEPGDHCVAASQPHAVVCKLPYKWGRGWPHRRAALSPHPRGARAALCPPLAIGLTCYCFATCVDWCWGFSLEGRLPSLAAIYPDLCQQGSPASDRWSRQMFCTQPGSSSCTWLVERPAGPTQDGAVDSWGWTGL